MKINSSVLTSKTCNDQSRSTKQRITLIRRYSLLKSFLSKIFFQKDFKSIFSFQISFLFLVFLFINQCSSSQSSSEATHPSRRLSQSISAGDILGVQSAINDGGLKFGYGKLSREDVHELVISNAIEKNRNDILELLLKSGANPNAIEIYGKDASPLGRAALNCKPESFKLLVIYGADINYMYSVDSETYSVADMIDVCEDVNKRKEILSYFNKIKKNPLAKKSSASSADFTETVTLKNGQTITSVKTKIAGDTIVVDYPNGNTKVFKKTEVKGVERN